MTRLQHHIGVAPLPGSYFSKFLFNGFNNSPSICCEAVVGENASFVASHIGMNI